ncbi:MAG: hypothetical protein ACXWTG_12115 [Methylosarcina sp.]
MKTGQKADQHQQSITDVVAKLRHFDMIHEPAIEPENKSNPEQGNRSRGNFFYKFKEPVGSWRGLIEIRFFVCHGHKQDSNKIRIRIKHTFFKALGQYHKQKGCQSTYD